MNSTKLIYKLLKTIKRSELPVKVSSVRRANFRQYARIIAAGKK